MKHYRPVSNLSFISKLTERVVSKQLLSHVESCNLEIVYQSAYKQFHSTETALLKVQSDILNALDGNSVSLLVLLDLSAAFDTVDIGILLQRLENRFRVSGNVLKWLQSYLENRRQSVMIESSQSESVLLKCGVPQGSVLGPLLFTLYTAPLGDISDMYHLKYHLYADDTQLHLSFNPCNPMNENIALQNISNCIAAIKKWMFDNKLQLNDGKTDFIVIGKPKNRLKVQCESLVVGNANVTKSDKVTNLGVTFDENMNVVSYMKMYVIQRITISVFNKRGCRWFYSWFHILSFRLL